MPKNQITISGNKIFMNGEEFLPKGIRCSAGLYSDEKTDELIRNLPVYKSYGLNSISVFLMGSRFLNIRGYLENQELNEEVAKRLEKVLEAVDKENMMCIVGCIYWGETKSKYESWGQKEVSNAVRNTVKWIKERGYRNIILDVDNEGMAQHARICNDKVLIDDAKNEDASILVGSNFGGPVPENADLGLHHSFKNNKNKPYIESEGVPLDAPGGYWQRYSRKLDLSISNYRCVSSDDYPDYMNIGIYTEDMKRNQIEATRMHLDNGQGYFMASTWLQAPAPNGPNFVTGGYGTKDDPGILWWLEFMKKEYM